MYRGYGRRRGHARDLAVFAMLGTILFCGDILMEWAPNIHFVGALIVTYTVVYRVRALIPLYVYVFLNGVYSGFGLWWIPYLYIWTILWGIAMLLPRHMPRRVAIPVYMITCALHGLAFGALYAPFQALAFGLDFSGMLAWIAAGLPFDLIHAWGNLAVGALVVPLSELLRRLERQSGKATAERSPR